MRSGVVARVLIDNPLPQLDHLFDYGVPEALAGAIRVGQRVKVPFRSGGRIIDAYVIELVDAAEADDSFSGTLSDIDSLVSTAAVLTPEVYELARRIADRGAGSAIDVVRLAVPPRAVRAEKKWLAAQADAEAAESAPSRDPVASPAVPSAEPALPGLSGYTDAVVAGALDPDGRVAMTAVPRLVQTASGAWVGHWALTMAELAARTLAGGRSALLAVPDFRDQEQLLAALHALLPAEQISRFDARQTTTERYSAFLACLGPEPRVVVGNRSVVYAPASALGLIALWDDGDPLYAESLAPYANARDVALIRQGLSGSALVLLGHARSIEAQRLVEIGWLHELAPERFSRPNIIATAQQGQPDEHAQAARIPSLAWREAKDGLGRGPVLVQVASPGYAPVVACASCREAARCAHCQGPLGQNAPGAAPSCRWCGAIAANWTCGTCGGHALRTVRIGAGRTAEELGRAFPGALVVVADGENPILSVSAKPALVIATRGAEPVAAGGYAAVLLLDGERMLGRESLRVAEDALRWWSNAAVLAAPGAPVILAGVGGALASALGTWQQAQWAAREFADRRALRFPPAVRTASVTAAPAVLDGALAELRELDGVDILGPVPAPPAGPGAAASDGLMRAIVRFDYAAGAEVARRLRAAIVAVASSRRRPPKGGAFRPAPTLRVRFDDPEIF
ncbi:primosomal protein N' family DNA-binding protein [Microterricola pindariensis]|uniref:Probable replication restart protein PriA n=1 Tax=Microterricola pindariensis TaxID=478010 RepID=A0ABX5B1L9_9MICO|nr:primosomal protein N' [Microterricola pindariensis]PPL20570.1 preprotein translocase subunit SecA [Microterricola pindariensis]